MSKENNELLNAIQTIVENVVSKKINEIGEGSLEQKFASIVEKVVDSKLIPIKNELVAIKRKGELTFEAVGELKIITNEIKDRVEGIDSSVDAVGTYLKNNLDSRVEKLESIYH